MVRASYSDMGNAIKLITLPLKQSLYLSYFMGLLGEENNYVSYVGSSLYRTEQMHRVNSSKAFDRKVDAHTLTPHCLISREPEGAKINFVNFPHPWYLLTILTRIVANRKINIFFCKMVSTSFAS